MPTHSTCLSEARDNKKMNEWMIVGTEVGSAEKTCSRSEESECLDKDGLLLV